MKISIVDDEKIYRDEIEKAFRIIALDTEIKTYESGEEFLKKYH